MDFYGRHDADKVTFTSLFYVFQFPLVSTL